MQIQADVLNTVVVRPEITEVTALGAAYLAGLATNFWSSKEELESQWKVNRVFKAGHQNNDALIQGWQRAVRAAKAWAEG